ncbi:hypothetical protein L596_028141 [Steinernema carpocapsae]|uniref:Uncharacterized protein n=1 Tax=Steinernema carpocapsae TaxID=34508 RepID=A0A4U5LXJ2_STECR|nr:hypothetical protein L596_028141 [Steinernema carpocapsae]
MQRQQKNTVYDHILPKICRQLIRQKADPDVIKEVSDRISAGFQHQYRIYDHVVFSLLTYRGYSPHDKFEMLAKFVDVIDSERERIHITLPLLTCCDDVDENMKMLYRITKLLGYQDLSLLDVGVMSKRILIPLLNRQRYEPDYVKRLDTLARVLKSYGVSEEVSYKLVLNWWNYLKVDKRSDRHQQEEIRTWLEHNWDQIWIKEKPLPGPVLSFENLQALIDQGSNERVHSEIVKHGWPKNTNFKTLAPQIIDLYLKSADWGSTTKMLNMLSSACNKDTGPETGPEDYPVKNVHLIQIMLRKVFDSPTLEVSSIVDFAYELRRMFPYATTENSTYVETLNASNKLFGSILLNKKRAELTADRVDRVIDLLVTMIRMDMLSLLINETLTSKIISSVLSSLGWNAAVETWMKFQSKLYLSNGMLALLKYSISYSQNRDHTQFVLHKSKTYLSQSRSNAIYVAALMTVGKETEAEQFLKTITHQIRPVDAMHVFRLLNAFNFRTHDHQSTTAFARLCLQYTDLKNDETACALFHDDWLRVCEQNKLGQLPLELYDLFKSYGRDLSQEQKRRVFDLATKHKSLAQKWIFDQEGPYHLLNVTEESRKQFISEFEDRLQRLEEELKDPETKRLVPELDESKLLGNILNLQLHDELLLNPEISNEEVDKMLEGIAS